MSWMIFPDQPWLSITLISLFLMVILYFSRFSARKLIVAVTRFIHSQLRSLAKVLTSVIRDVKRRNRDVLLEMSKTKLERKLNRDFYLLSKLVSTELAYFPELQQSISALIIRLEEDYHQTADTPLEEFEAEWVETIEVAIETHHDSPELVNVLEKLLAASSANHKKRQSTLQNSIAKRHKLLHSMMPSWRKLNHSIERVSGVIQSLNSKVVDIDNNMDRFREIDAGSEKIERQLNESALKDWFVSVFWMSIFVTISYFNFKILAASFSEVVGTRLMILSLSTSEVSALIMVLANVVIGLLIMEVLYVTHMFSVFNTFDDNKRRLWLWVLSGGLIVFSMMVSVMTLGSSSISSEQAILEQLVFTRELSVEGEIGSVGGWYSLVTGLLLGFLLPFVVIFVAIPMEVFFDNSRILLGRLLSTALNLVVLTLRLLAHSTRYLGLILMALYDILICIPLWLERQWSKRKVMRSTQPEGLE